ncbi:hypothetical protein [Streptomyces olivaceus]|uniref:hypothetical protein n=1 Tax=Streptomyces olivaceus TaxID=47716 RepID=UPI0036572B37
MLITPRPGAHFQNIRDALSSAHLATDNLRSAHNTSAYRRLLQYLEVGHGHLGHPAAPDK